MHSAPSESYEGKKNLCCSLQMVCCKPGNLVHHTLSMSKYYVQPNTAELLVKEQITVLHVAIIVIPLLVWFCFHDYY